MGTAKVNSAAAITPRRLTVEFSGLPTRRGPLTLAQANVKLMLDATADHFDWNQCIQFNLPPGVSVTLIARMVRELLTQNESLRTIFPDDQETYQLVLDDGAVPVLVYEADTDPAELARKVALTLRQSTRFDLTIEPPFKVAVVTANGTPAKILLLLSHIAADLIGVRLLQQDIRLFFEHRPLPSASQPVDVALEEHSEVWKRRVSRSLRYWEAQLMGMPQAAFLTPAPEQTDCYGIKLRSNAVVSALAAVSRRNRTSPSTVLLSLLAILVGVQCAQRRVTITSISANRIGQLKNYVGTLAQDALIIADLQHKSVDDFISAMRPQAIRAYTSSRFEATALWRVIHNVEHRRGIHFTRDVVFNDRSWVPDESLAPQPNSADDPGSQITRLPVEPYSTRCMLSVDTIRDELGITLRADPGCLPEEQGEALVRALMTLLLRAEKGAVAMADVPGIIGIFPRLRGPGWHLVDSCPINLDAVRRLLVDVLHDLHHAVFVENAETDARLLCHLVSGGDAMTPARIHERCIRLLPGRPDAMAPHSYRVYRQAPTELLDPSAWRKEELLWQEDGRGTPRG
jgi:hypothetical protein